MQKPDFMYLKNLTVPIVLLDTYCDFPNVDCVMINNMQGAFNATVRLIHKHIGQPGYLHSSYPIHAYADMLELLEQNTPLASCYFADNDNIAIGAMKAFQHKGYKIPADISIIGFDNMPLSTSVIPALSTIHVPKQNLGKTAAERLINVIESDEYYSVKIEISATYIARKSVI